MNCESQILFRLLKIFYIWGTYSGRLKLLLALQFWWVLGDYVRYIYTLAVIVNKQQTNMKTTRLLKLWLPIIGLHALHQLEESISFFQWYIENASKIPNWLLITSINNARIVITHPEYFILASLGQLFFISLLAFLFRHKEKATKFLLFTYIVGLTFFLVWHVLTSYIAHSYAPIMVTCIGGLYFIPIWINKLFNLTKQELNP